MGKIILPHTIMGSAAFNVGYTPTDDNETIMPFAHKCVKVGAGHSL